MFFRETEDGIELFARLTPRAASDRIDGVAKTADGRDHLAARVRAVPEKGAANAAFEKLLAGQIGLPKSAVKVIAGHTARHKTVRLEGDKTELAKRLSRLTGNQ